MENPRTDSPHAPRPVSALPDPSVTYQFVLMRPGGVIQLLSQFTFTPDSAQHNYVVRNFPAKVGAQTLESHILGRHPWGVDLDRPYEEYLETILIEPAGAPASALTISQYPISSRHFIDTVAMGKANINRAAIAAPSSPMDFHRRPCSI